MDQASLFDGNALAGALSTLFASEPTTLVVECGACGAVGMIADTVVERDDSAAIVRCRSCTHTLFTLTEHDGGARLTIESLRLLATAEPEAR